MAASAGAQRTSSLSGQSFRLAEKASNCSRVSGVMHMMMSTSYARQGFKTGERVCVEAGVGGQWRAESGLRDKADLHFGDSTCPGASRPLLGEVEYLSRHGPEPFT